MRELLLKVSFDLMELGFIEDSIKFQKIATESVYIVESGDTISGIAGGNYKLQQAIIKANPGLSPDKLQVGQKIKIPYHDDDDEVIKYVRNPHTNSEPENYVELPEQNTSANYSGNTYKIKSGDTVYALTNGEAEWLALVKEKNPGVNLSKLQIGAVINLPKRPSYPNESRTISSSAKAKIKAIEKYSPILYPDASREKHPTIGYGHKIEEGENLDVYKTFVGTFITPQAASKLFEKDIKLASDATGRKVHVKLTDGQFDAIISLVFNCGITGFMNSKMYKDVELGDMKAAAASLPDVRMGDDLDGLIVRRQMELKMFLS